MNNTTIEKTYEKIQSFAQNPLGDQRVIDAIGVGYHVRQGDLYIKRIDGIDKGEYKVTSNRQLAPGTNKGSRHTVNDSVTVYEHVSKQGEATTNSLGFMINGPVIECPERFSVSHPEHADMSLPAGIYQINYQVDPATMRRVLD
jgi:hypothetical protein